jgi:hypothetical protein
MRYTKYLAEQGKFTLCIWPEHCLVININGCSVINSSNMCNVDRDSGS